MERQLRKHYWAVKASEKEWIFTLSVTTAVL